MHACVCLSMSLTYSNSHKEHVREDLQPGFIKTDKFCLGDGCLEKWASEGCYFDSRGYLYREVEGARHCSALTVECPLNRQ